MFSFKRMFAVTKKETIEMVRDPSRIVANFIVPLVLMFLFSSGMNLDIKNIPFVVLDFDNSAESRQYSDSYINSDYYDYLGHIYSSKDADRLMQLGKIKFYLDIPSGFGRQLLSQKGAQIAVFVDGTQPFRAQSIKGYVAGTNMIYIRNKLTEDYGAGSGISNYSIKSRYWYNQANESKYTFVPSIIAIILITIPAIMMTLSIVGEKEAGTITNFYATPLTKLEFLFGKQLIYLIMFFITYLVLVFVAVFLYRVPMKGSFIILTLLAIIYILATTSIGLFVSSFVKSQIAGLLIAMIITMIPSFAFSGLLKPISSLDGGGKFMSLLYPTAYFMESILGTFTKNIPISSILPNFLWITLFYFVIMYVCVKLLKKQDN